MLKKLNFTVEAGEILAIVGFNGSGKYIFVEERTRITQMTPFVIQENRLLPKYYFDSLILTVENYWSMMWIYDGTTPQSTMST